LNFCREFLDIVNNYDGIFGCFDHVRWRPLPLVWLCKQIEVKR
jgi:hypothetical protein